MSDLRLLLPAVACWLGALAGGHLWLMPPALLVALCWRTPVVAAAASCFVGGVLVVVLRQQALATGPLAPLAAKGAAVTVDVVLSGDAIPVVGGRGPTLFITDARVEHVESEGRAWHLRAPLLLLAHGEAWASYQPSTHLRLAGHLKPADGSDDVAAVLLVGSKAPEVTRGPSPVEQAAGRLRQGLRTAAAPLPGGADGLLPGLVIGDTSRLSAADKADFKADGLTHIVAVSGTNVTAVLTGVLSLMRLCGVRRRPAAVIAALSLVGFVIVARPSASVVRAAVMGWIALAAWVGGRQRTAAGTLAAAVIVLLLLDPVLAHSAGFALSVLACAGLLFLAPGWRDALQRRGLSAAWAEALAVPAAAQVACTPIIAGIGGGMSMVAIPANLLVAPAVGPATTLGVLSALAATFSMSLAHLLADLAALPTLWLLAVAHTWAAVPGATVGWPSGTGGAVLALCACAGTLFVSRRLGRWRQRG